MEGRIDQIITGNGNVQVGRDLVVKISRSRACAPGDRLHAQVLYAALIVLLVGTTLPHPLINLAASIGAILMWLAWSMTARRLVKPTLVVIAAFSILSGCAGPLFTGLDCPPFLFGQATSCKTGVAEGFAVFGIGLEKINPQTAKENGGLTKVLASQEVRGYGLISMAKVRVYGE